jgi:RimJ/RimL family protein N-acetyltransferase
VADAPVLRTQRLILRGLTAADFDAFASLWAEPGVVRHITGAVSSPAQSWSRMLKLAGSWPLVGYGYWAVEEAATGRFAGQAGFAEFMRGMDAGGAGLPEAGWVFAPDCQGRGYATEAMTAALDWADRTLQARMTWCLIAPDNAASIRVAEKVGYAGRLDTQHDGQPAVMMFRGRGG